MHFAEKYSDRLHVCIITELCQKFGTEKQVYMDFIHTALPSSAGASEFNCNFASACEKYSMCACSSFIRCSIHVSVLAVSFAVAILKLM